ncbi:hypothetical protein GGI20_005904, partial [Coemansia sp. BCRC 34301]
QPQTSVPNAATAYHCYVSGAGLTSLPAAQSYSNVSSALYGSSDRLPLRGTVHNAGEVDQMINMSMGASLARPHSVQQQLAGQFGGVCSMNYAQQQMAVPHSAAATAVMIASQYPSMYYGVPGFGFGSGPATFPIYTYGA